MGITRTMPLKSAPPAVRSSWLTAAAVSSTSLCSRGKKPTDIPASRSTSKVAIMSSQPPSWARVPASTSRLRIESTRTNALCSARGSSMSRMASAAMNCRGTTTVE